MAIGALESGQRHSADFNSKRADRPIDPSLPSGQRDRSDRLMFCGYTAGYGVPALTAISKPPDGILDSNYGAGVRRGIPISEYLISA